MLLSGITAASSSLHLSSLRQAIEFCVIPWCFKLCISEWIRVEILCVVVFVAIWILKEFTHIVANIVEMVVENMEKMQCSIKMLFMLEFSAKVRREIYKWRIPMLWSL